MRPDPLDVLKYRFLGAAAVLLLGIAHGVHDLSSGNSALPAFLPTVTVTLQVATLSMGQALAQRRGWSRAIALILAVFVSLAFGSAAVALHSTKPSTLAGASFAIAAAGLGVFGFWLLVFYFPSKLHEVRVRALIAEASLRRAELARLRSTLHPHFLVNALNAVAGLLVSDPRQARQLVIALGDLIRDSLDEGDEMTSLDQEVAWLRRYAEVFEIRYRDAIHFKWDLSHETLTTAVPRLLLQPLIENAITHGALHHPGGGTVTLRSAMTENSVRIEVHDDGPGMDSNQPWGLGLCLVRDQLQVAYKGAKMGIDSSSAGTCVALKLPRAQVPND